jgi:hypothetical protein
MAMYRRLDNSEINGLTLMGSIQKG